MTRTATPSLRARSRSGKKRLSLSASRGTAPALPARRVSGGSLHFDDRIVKALGHPTRVRALQILERRATASPSEMADELNIPLGTMGYHVRRLEVLGIIEIARCQQRRGVVEHFYRTVTAGAATDDAASVQRVVRATILDADLTTTLAEVRAAVDRGGFDSAKTHLLESVVRLDAAGRQCLADEMERLGKRVEEIQAESAARLARRPAGDARVLQMVMLNLDVPAERGRGRAA